MNIWTAKYVLYFSNNFGGCIILEQQYEAALGKSLASRSVQSKAVKGVGSVSSAPSGMRVMQLFFEMKATILSTRRLGGEGHVKSSWDSLSSGALGIQFCQAKPDQF